MIIPRPRLVASRVDADKALDDVLAAVRDVYVGVDQDDAHRMIARVMAARPRWFAIAIAAAALRRLADIEARP